MNLDEDEVEQLYDENEISNSIVNMTTDFKERVIMVLKEQEKEINQETEEKKNIN